MAHFTTSLGATRRVMPKFSIEDVNLADRGLPLDWEKIDF